MTRPRHPNFAKSAVDEGEGGVTHASVRSSLLWRLLFSPRGFPPSELVPNSGGYARLTRPETLRCLFALSLSLSSYPVFLPLLLYILLSHSFSLRAPCTFSAVLSSSQKKSENRSVPVYCTPTGLMLIYTQT